MMMAHHEGRRPGSKVEVRVRIRPVEERSCTIYMEEGTMVKLSAMSGGKEKKKKEEKFEFDYVYGESTSQSEVYRTAVGPLVESVIDGYNATILAYGQTGSGKTYSMGTGADVMSEHAGCVPRAVGELLERCKDTHCISLTYVEIYNEELRDLLVEESEESLVIRERVDGEIFVSGLKEVEIKSMQAVYQILKEGAKHRSTHSTINNEASSRSHAVLSVSLKSTSTLLASSSMMLDEASLEKSRQSCVIRSKLHCVDLAGSERVKAFSSNNTARIKEGIHINTGLLALGKVISALSDHQKYIPYRESKLTRILQNSLGGSSRTVMLACITPQNYHESITTLSYASRARKIHNKVRRNAAVLCPLNQNEDHLHMIFQLKQQLAQAHHTLYEYQNTEHQHTKHFHVQDANLRDRLLAAEAAGTAALHLRKEETPIVKNKTAIIQALEQEIKAKQVCIHQLALSEKQASQALQKYEARLSMLEGRKDESPELEALKKQQNEAERIEALRAASERQMYILNNEAQRLRAEKDALANDAAARIQAMQAKNYRLEQRLTSQKHQEADEKEAARWLKHHIDAIIHQNQNSVYGRFTQLKQEVQQMPPHQSSAVVYEACRQLVASHLARQEDATALASARTKLKSHRAENRCLQRQIQDIKERTPSSNASSSGQATVEEYEAKISCLLRELKHHESQPPSRQNTPSYAATKNLSPTISSTKKDKIRLSSSSRANIAQTHPSPPFPIMVWGPNQD